MKYSDFEKQIGAKLRDQEVLLDTAAFYKTLTQQKKKRKGGAIIILLSSLLLTGLVGYAFMPSAFKVKSITTEHATQQLDNNTSTNVINQDLKITQENENSTVDALSQQQLEASSTHLTMAENSPSEPIKTQASSSEVQNSLQNDVRTKSSSTQKNDYKSPSVSNKAIDNNTNTINSNLNQNPSNFILDTESTFNTPNSKNSEKSNASQNSSTTVAIPTAQESANQLTELTFLDLLLTPIALKTEKLPITTKIECPDFRINKRLFDFEIIGEIGYFRPLKTFDQSTATGNETNELRSTNESSREGYHAGLHLKFTSTKLPIYIQAGLTQDFLTERMKIEYSYTKRDTTQGIISITESENGDTLTFIKGDIVTETEISGFKKRHYRLQMIDVPVVAGYEFGLNRFTVGLEAGVLFNLKMRSMGNILASNVDFETIENQNPFKSSVSLSYLGGINLGYRLTSKSKIYLSTKCRIIPDNINSPSNSLSQKYNFLGVNLGYGYLF